MVDFLATSVTDLIRPFADSDLTVARRWYRVPWGTPTLAFPTVFMSTRYEAFPYLERGAGPVWPTPVNYVRRRTPAGLTFDHVCGTAPEFAGHALFNPAVNVQYDDEWIPECCDRADVGFHGGIEVGGEFGDKVTHVDPLDGGIEVGGEVGDLVVHVDPLDGGIEVGGSMGESRDYVDPLDGGIEVGGEMGDVFTPGAPTPGPSCGAATVVALNTDYVYNAPTNGFDQQWWVLPVAAFSSFTIYTTGIDAVSVQCEVSYGPNCGSRVVVWSIYDSPTHVNVDPDFMWFKVTAPGGAGTTYTFRIE